MIFGILGSLTASLLSASVKMPNSAGAIPYSFLVAMAGAVIVIHISRYQKTFHKVKAEK